MLKSLPRYSIALLVQQWRFYFLSVQLFAIIKRDFPYATLVSF